MKKVIGISSTMVESVISNTLRVDENYINAVLHTGASPVCLPIPRDVSMASRFVERLDGLILSGGSDIAPFLYNENPIPEAMEYQFERDAMEIALLQAAYEKKLPTLGICRGMQLANVHFGGTLHQDLSVQLPDALEHHTKDWKDSAYHFVEVEGDSILGKCFSEKKVIVNSHHHQGIRDLAPSFRVTARSADGLPEAVEYLGDWNFHGVQFHPERLYFKDEFCKIFKILLEVC